MNLASLILRLLVYVFPSLRNDGIRFDVIAESARRIFHYWTGSGKSSADPIEVYHRLMEHAEFVPERHGQGVDEGDAESTRITCDAVRQAFGIKPLADGGLTIGELLELYSTFCIYIEDLKKSTDHLLTSPSPTESTSSPSPDVTTPPT